MPSSLSRVATAKRLLQVRKLRLNFFSGGLFDEHGWTVLLILFVASAEGRPITSAEVALEGGANAETGVRWMKYLQQADMVTLGGETDDGPVELALHARVSLGDYLQEVAALFVAKPQDPHPWRC